MSKGQTAIGNRRTGGWRIEKLSALNGSTKEALDDAWTKPGSGDFQSPFV
ncbi:MAG: hypothetical protein H7X84_04935 [Verrucomicrobia bacterium]|nr:hypothetical protein [Prolixibacteraceae bacterium]